MAMLIRGGTLLTMTERGSFVGDVLISGGCILRVEEHIPEAEDFTGCTLDAKGLTVMPGMVDLCLRSHGSSDAWMEECSLHAGITTALLHPEDGRDCRLMLSGSMIASDCILLSHEQTEAEGLSALLTACHAQGKRVLCAVSSPEQCMHVLEAARGTGVQLLLLGHEGLADMTEAIAEAGAGVIVGVNRPSASRPGKPPPSWMKPG